LSNMVLSFYRLLRVCKIANYSLFIKLIIKIHLLVILMPLMLLIFRRFHGIGIIVGACPHSPEIDCDS